MGIGKRRDFGSDPMDGFSIAIDAYPTPKRLGTIIVAPIRASWEKPGRALVVLHDERNAILPGFNPTYSYFNVLWRADCLAGKHYHLLKKEVFTALTGSFMVYLKSIDGKAVERIQLRAPVEGETQLTRLYIPEGVAHMIQALANPSIIHVSATAPNTKEDEISFEM